jgi:hypothetical protein
MSYRLFLVYGGSSNALKYLNLDTTATKKGDIKPPFFEK